MIDWGRVRQLRDEIGADEFSEVVDLFIEEVDDEIVHLRDCTYPENLDARLHCLKGSALNLGFQDLSKLCRDGEAAVAQGHADLVDIDAIVVCYTASRGAFLEGLETLGHS